MKKAAWIKYVLVFWMVGLAFDGLIFSQERYFDTAEPASNQVRLTIFYPATGSINALEELRKNGFIAIENLLVIGVYHEKERTDYKPAIEYVAEHHLEWIKFHRLSGELNRDILFQKNNYSIEFEKIFNHSDGIIFFGGADIPPYIYHEKTLLLTEIETPYRSFLETSFIFHLLGGSQNKEVIPLLESSPEFPILGICLGCQSLNVGTGGSLTQDIWSEIYHKNYLEDVFSLGKERWHTNPYHDLYPEKNLLPYNMHRIKFLDQGKFITVFGFDRNDYPYILSSHHQMPNKLGTGFKVIATSLDEKVVEAIEHKKYPNVLGVQFHPEFPILWDSTTGFRFTPQDQEELSLRAILEKNPPSYQFHQHIWKWFCEKLTAYHESKN